MNGANPSFGHKLIKQKSCSTENEKKKEVHLAFMLIGHNAYKCVCDPTSMWSEEQTYHAE